MIFILKDNEKEILEIDITFFLTDYKINNYVIINNHPLFKNISNQIIKNFLNNRIINKSRINLDYIYCNSINNNLLNIGRLSNYSYFLSFINCFSSGYDNFLLIPKDKYLFSFFLEDFNFNNIFILDRNKKENNLDIFSYKFEETQNYKYSNSLVINSIYPSDFIFKENLLYIKQQYINQNYKFIEDILVKPTLENNFLYYKLDGNIIQISDLLIDYFLFKDKINVYDFIINKIYKIYKILLNKKIIEYIKKQNIDQIINLKILNNNSILKIL